MRKREGDKNVMTLVKSLAGRVLIALSMSLCMAAPSFAEGEGDKESILKAALLYNFTKFVTWPERSEEEGSTDTLVVCVLGGQEIQQAMKSIEGQMVEARSIVVQQILDPENLPWCDVAYFAKTEDAPLEASIDYPRSDKPILTVSDHPGFALAGGVIEIIREDNKLAFDVNLTSARYKSLPLSSRLLSLARNIYDEVVTVE